MKFTLAAVVAFAATALARPLFTNSDFPNLETGDSITIKWDNATGPVTITLMNGPRNQLQPVKDIATGETGDEFTFVVTDDIKTDTYAFRIYDEASKDDPNYSLRFEIEGAAVSSSSSTTRSTTSTSSSSSSTPSPSTNTSSTTTTRSATTTTPTTTPTSSPTNNLSGAERYSSSLALVLITVAALAFFN